MILFTGSKSSGHRRRITWNCVFSKYNWLFDEIFDNTPDIMIDAEAVVDLNFFCGQHIAIRVTVMKTTGDEINWEKI